MSSARRPLLTATAAGTLLGALWFVPSANATADGPAREVSTVTQTTQAGVTTTNTAATAASLSDGTRLADTGSFDSTPYVVGGAFCLTLGAGFVVYSVRRERLGL
ncbi:hypothetical protein [Streptomyces chromofuscus]|uniref:Uncharacterized protein n=1 Tax=Streptomyces chromofuscus TaxID=42881 RepID=A0A7M2T404_STRCW|nr:hypothetical protein [Streptomyces chromofuscus]QOV42625.1 hypothetical protein IPT68_22780 [Streptomyces chromofuscus]GGS89473.1 hypothetical protein GCM10010254_06580 [Streptomyces chromofuscus]